jgi:hypothetical protein
VAYVDLGKYTFTTGQDFTGLNTGNLTSILPLSSIKIPYFEMYRLTIDTSSLSTVTPIPVIVQDSGLVTGTSLSTLNITMPKATTVGNTLVGLYSSFGLTLNPTVTGITIGASADNWAVVPPVGGTTGTDAYAAVWADPSCAQASTAVVISTANGSGTTFNCGRVLEMGDMFATTSATAAKDVGISGDTTGGTLTSFNLPTPATTAVNDFAVGIGMFNSAPNTFSVTAAPPWTSLYTATTAVGGTFDAGVSSYGFTGPSGTTFPYNLTTTVQGGTGLAAMMFRASTTPVAAPSFPFTVSIDQQQWDIQMTAAGTGYTYSIGDSPLYLRNSQNLEILWTSLPYSVYATYAPALRCTAWFRYDPTAQQAGNVAGHA